MWTIIFLFLWGQKLWVGGGELQLEQRHTTLWFETSFMLNHNTLQLNNDKSHFIIVIYT